MFMKGWYKQNNNNPEFKDAEAKQGSPDRGQETTWYSNKCN